LFAEDPDPEFFYSRRLGLYPQHVSVNYEMGNELCDCKP